MLDILLHSSSGQDEYRIRFCELGRHQLLRTNCVGVCNIFRLRREWLYYYKDEGLDSFPLISAAVSNRSNPSDGRVDDSDELEEL